MFSVGDKVVYPMHGAGIAQAIEQHELAGEAVDYLVMVMLLTDMRVMVPLKKCGTCRFAPYYHQR